jgi:hypothetical protein
MLLRWISKGEHTVCVPVLIWQVDAEPLLLKHIRKAPVAESSLQVCAAKRPGMKQTEATRINPKTNDTPAELRSILYMIVFPFTLPCRHQRKNIPTPMEPAS